MVFAVGICCFGRNFGIGEEFMKRIALVILLVVSAFACGKDNNSEARYALDGNGCLINAFDYDWTATSISGQGTS